MKTLFLTISLLFLTSCTNDTNEPAETSEVASSSSTSSSIEEPILEIPHNLTLTPAFEDLSFEDPLYITYIPESNTPLIVERTGIIYSVQNDEKNIFLDLTDQIDSSSQEQGLLGLALDPAFTENHFFYVNYTANGQTFISRFVEGDEMSEEVLLSFEQPYTNHNGGHLAFGPDGMLYIASGDGGSSGDPQYNAQSRESLLGKILRLDVHDEQAEVEIFAFGLRNPWRFSFDRETGALWAGDVGQNTMEEINIIEEGNNYGWNIFEGSNPYDSTMMMDGMMYYGPVWEYEHDHGRSVTGGYVYRGQEFPALEGMYIYGDFVSGTIWALETENGTVIENHELMQTDLSISSFGEDETGELYIVDFSGNIFQFDVD